MNYQEAMAFLEETKKYGSQLGLTSIKNLMGQLGNIQDQIPVVHIGGTNGKGSVGAMLSSVLTEAGYKVGRFNTPDVFFYEEEFLINGVPIEKERLAQIFSKIAAACDRMTANGLPHPTRFEVETAAAFLWFFEEKADLTLLEVGMGGETDATNIIKRPLVSVLTSISMDHMRFLGNTLTDIAGVKAGIIKENCPVVCMEQEEEVLSVIRKRAEQRKAPFVVSRMEMAENLVCTTEETSFDWKTDPMRISLGLHGSYQVENAVCVLHVLKILQEKYPGIDDLAIGNGLKNVCWPGRFEQISSNPTIILDGAHNEDAVRKLRASLDEVFPGKNFVYIMGVLADKEYDRMIEIMFQPADRVFTLTPPNPRALSSQKLARKLLEKNVAAVACEKIEDAVSCSLQEATRETVIVAFGSLSYLAEVKKAFAGER